MFCSELCNCFSGPAVRITPQQFRRASFYWQLWDWHRVFALARRLLRSKARQREYCIVQRAVATATAEERAPSEAVSGDAIRRLDLGRSVGLGSHLTASDAAPRRSGELVHLLAPETRLWLPKIVSGMAQMPRWAI